MALNVLRQLCCQMWPITKGDLHFREYYGEVKKIISERK